MVGMTMMVVVMVTMMKLRTWGVRKTLEIGIINSSLLKMEMEMTEGKKLFFFLKQNYPVF